MITRIYAPTDYWRLKATDPEKLNEIAQGCGPHGTLDRLVPDKILGLSIKNACKVHDFMYAFGINEEDRTEADMTFLNNMNRLIMARGGFLCGTRKYLALLYYSAVRNFGGPWFWNDKNEEEEMVEVHL